MELVAAPGSQDMKDALLNKHVRAIADILLNEVEKGETEKDFFILIISFLQKHMQKTSADFAEDLQELRNFNNRRLDTNTQFIHPSYLDKLCLALAALYDATREKAVDFRRGAILESLAYELVKDRCQSNECRDNHRFVDRATRYQSDQVDVAVLSHTKMQIEGYACKLTWRGIKSEDCTNLSALSKKGKELCYFTRVGAISFSHSRSVRRRLREFSSTEMIIPYGLDNLSNLMQSPFNP